IKPSVVYGHDVGVVEPGGRSSLSEEPLHHPFGGVGLLENLEGHIAIEPGVERQEDLSETAIPQPFPQLKPPERPERPPAPGFRPAQRRIRGAGLGLEQPLESRRHPRLGLGVILSAVDVPAAVWAEIALFACLPERKLHAPQAAATNHADWCTHRVDSWNPRGSRSNRQLDAASLHTNRITSS